MYAYHLAPVDFGWEYLPSFLQASEIAARIDAENNLHDRGPYTVDDHLSNLRRLHMAFNEAREKAEAVGWEGDYREFPRVFMLPEPGGFEMLFAFVWKQDNNGSTFLVSPIELPAYKEHSMI